MADAIEALAALEPQGGVQKAGVTGRLGLATLRALERSAWGRRLLLDEREMHSKKRRAEEERRAVSWT
jgi:hypothetical protein